MLWLAALWRRQFTLNFKNFNRSSGDKTCETKVVGHTNIGLHIKFGGFSIIKYVGVNPGVIDL